jgi:SSS family solute:Na+ symporter
MLAAIGATEITIILVYLLGVAYLGWLGYSRTRNAADYLVAGRKAHPAIMALSYGATFISTSAIVGFGGVAGTFGMSLLWLTFCNIFVGIFIAFVALGGPTRRIGHRLDAHTFPELLGRRFDSKFIQVFAGLVIFLFMPLYSAAVLVGGSEFVAASFEIDYNVALLVFSVIVAAYVMAGGLKSVMYTDALQGVIMFVGMLILLGYAYYHVGGVTSGHQALTDMKDMVPGGLKDTGHRGWTATPEFGWSEQKHNLWWVVFSTIVLGVGIGVLAQPQLVVRFMTVKSKRELNRAVAVGGVFILAMTGVAFTVGALSNVYFSQHGSVLTGKVAKVIDAEKGHAVLQIMEKDQSGKWVPKLGGDKKPAMAPVVLAKDVALDESATQAGLQAGRTISIVTAGGNYEKIIPKYIKDAMPPWFGVVFLLTLLSAAMSTASSQVHTMGTAIGRDVYGRLGKSQAGTVSVTRMGMLLGILAAVLFSFYARGGVKGEMIVARATAIFFGLCASTFLAAFVGGLFFKRMTKAGAVASMVTGCLVTVFWLLLVKSKEAGLIGLVQLLTDGQTSILAGKHPWYEVDPLVVALPLAALAAIVVSIFTKPPRKELVDQCFAK